MIQFIDGSKPYVTYSERSYLNYNSALRNELQEQFGLGIFNQEPITTDILKFSQDWATNAFLNLIHKQIDVRFLYYLFTLHENSILLYLDCLKNEELLASKNVNISTLSLNRRILKLALEQSCDIKYKGDNTADPSIMAGFLAAVEDLLFLGERIFSFAEYRAEQRMMDDPVEVIIENTNYEVRRKYHYDKIYHNFDNFFLEGFANGLVDTDAVKELRAELKRCMNIDYDVAGGIIMAIKEHHSPKAPNLQTIDYDILSSNLQAFGVSKENSDNFYEGLTISKENKLSIQDSVYKSHSFARYFFRPILIVNINGKDRALVGAEKWQESIMVMATNGFQWQQAPEEWKRNAAFNNYLSRKADEHDKLLEDRVQEILSKHNISFIRHVTSLTPLKGKTISINRSPGEIDFIFIDQNCKKVLVTDCKYHRARYEMVGFSSDYRNFRDNYEPKIIKKVNFIQENLQLLQEHFDKIGNSVGDISNYSVQGLFIVNSPTFYILNGNITTITITHLEELINDCYNFPAIKITMPEGETEIYHPYFSNQSIISK